MNTMYATKRRRRNGKGLKSPVKDVTKSNPSKRHRERLNAELDHLASLLPFEQSILSKLDKLSILRLSVSYLRTKSYFQAALHREHEDGLDRGIRRNTDSIYLDQSLMEGDLILQALNGFLLILTCDGEVFFASHTVENYLGFHQSDIVHQSVYELVHSEDREELQRHLMWNSLTSPESADMSVQEVLQPDNSHFLERNFTIRFRCLLDNTSGFLRLDIRGRIKVLHGQNCKTEEPPLGLFAVCCPFGPPSLLEMPQKDIMFKSKHKLDLSLVSMDPRGKLLLGYSDTEITNKGGYEWIHFDDLAYVASAHQELLKTGASGLIAYRLLTKDNQWQWLQTSSRLVYKNGKPDFVICTHRPLMEEEGRDLLGKRTIDFKMAYMDERGLGFSERSYSADNEFMSVIRSQKSKKFKSQLKDFLQSCRKKKNSYADVARENNCMKYEGAKTELVYSYPAENGINYVQQGVYTPLDNTRFLTPENFMHYRHLGGYYADLRDYHHSAQFSSNGFLDVSARTKYELTCPSYLDDRVQPKEEKLYPCQLDSSKCAMDLDKYNGENQRPFIALDTQKQTCCKEGSITSASCIISNNDSPIISSSNSNSHEDISNHNHRNRNNSSDSEPSQDKEKSSENCERSHSVEILQASTPLRPSDNRQSVLVWNNSASVIYTDHDKLKDLECNCNSPCTQSKWNCTSSKLSPQSDHQDHTQTYCTSYPTIQRTSTYQSELQTELTVNGRTHPIDLCHQEKHASNPLLSISEVTNTLLNHD